MSRAVPPLPHMSPWHALAQLCLYHNVCFQALWEVHTAHCDFFFRVTKSASIKGGFYGVCTFFEFNIRMMNDKSFNKFHICLMMLEMSFHYWEAATWELINWRKLLQAFCLTWQSSLWGLARYPLCWSPVWTPKVIYSVEVVHNCRAGYSSTIYWSTDVLYLHKVIALCWHIWILFIYFESLNLHCMSGA